MTINTTATNLHPQASNETRQLAERMLNNYASIDSCPTCDGERVLPDYSGCGDSSGGWADSCQHCRGKGFVYQNPRLYRLRKQAQATAELEAFKAMHPEMFSEVMV